MNGMYGLDTDFQNFRPAGLSVSTAENELFPFKPSRSVTKAVSQRGLSATAVSQLSLELLNCFKQIFSVFFKSHSLNTCSLALSTFNILKHL